jgi:hypothetical protein
VALFNASDETVDFVGWMREVSDVHELIGYGLEDMKRGRVDATAFLTGHNPQVVLIDISPPYQENWPLFQTLLRATLAMQGRGLVLITRNKARLDDALHLDSHAINIVGNAGVLQQIVTAVEDASEQAVT